MSSNIFRINRNFTLNFTNFAFKTFVVTKPLVFGILFWTSQIFVFKTVVVTKPLLSGTFLSTFPMLFSKFCLSVLYWFMRNKVVTSGIFFSKLFTFVCRLLNFVFLTTSSCTAALNFYFKFTGTVFNLPTSKHFTYYF